MVLVFVFNKSMMRNQLIQCSEGQHHCHSEWLSQPGHYRDLYLSQKTEEQLQDSSEDIDSRNPNDTSTTLDTYCINPASHTEPA